MDTKTVPTRTVMGREVPPVGRWQIDPTHSHIELTARHMMISKVRGRFRQFSGTIFIAEVPEDSWVEVIIDAASVDTGDATRDAHLRGADFLDVERHPQIRFRSTSVRPGTGDHWEVIGDVTIRDVTKSLTVNTELCGIVVDPWNKLRAAFLAETEINREDFDITWNQALETGGFLVGKGVKVEADIEAVYEDETPSEP